MPSTVFQSDTETQRRVAVESLVDSTPLAAMTAAHLDRIAPNRPHYQPAKLPTGLDAGWHRAASLLAMLKPRQRSIMREAKKIDALRERYQLLDSHRLSEKLEATRQAIRRQRDDNVIRHDALALVAVQCHRVLGLRPHRTQLAGAAAMQRSMLAEMATGEGKTLCAAMAAVLLGWRGRGCHVVTVNDYLAKRDAQNMRPLYQACALTVAHVDPEMQQPRKREAYRAGVTYATNQQLTADYLRDQLAKRQAGPNSATVMRDLWYAIIDEADSVLIDEAATPLIISQQSGDAKRTHAILQAAQWCRQFERHKHYTLDASYRQAKLTASGRRLIDQCAAQADGLWQVKRLREELIIQAIVARDLYIKHKEYIVDNGKIVIVDPSTGRQMPDRTWSQGIHQAVEAKEGLEVQPINETLARMSFQRYFRTYRFLAGMTGTAWEERHEFWRIYHLPVVRIARNRPLQRKDARLQTFATSSQRWRYVVEQVIERRARHQPILIGTASISESETLANLLEEQGIPHNVLNATTHAQEAMIIAKAGQPDTVTVATNMAGRGTDILLGVHVAELGGLCVIASVPNKARRIDRQLLGRCGRQGDPGQTLSLASLEDDIVTQYAPKWMRTLSRASVIRRLAVRSAQNNAETINRRGRHGVLRSDDWLDEHLGFAEDLT